jgi:hypothetical protein
MAPYVQACIGVPVYVYIYLYIYIYNDVYIPVMYLFCTYVHACMWVCTDTLCTQVSMRVCAQADATRIDACTCILRHRFSEIYNVHGHPSIFRRMYFGAASRRACARAVAAGARAGAPALGCICLRVQSPLRTHRCAYHACGCVFRACAVTFHGFGPFAPTSAHRRAAGAGRTRARCVAGGSPPRR